MELVKLTNIVNLTVVAFKRHRNTWMDVFQTSGLNLVRILQKGYAPE